MRVNVICIGGYGRTAASYIEKNDSSFKVLYLDTDERDVSKCTATDKHLVPSVSVIKASEAKLDNLRELVAYPSDLTFIVCGMGGKTATSLSVIVANILKENGRPVVSYVVTPFKAEGLDESVYTPYLSELKRITDGMLLFDNEILLERVANMMVSEAFSKVNVVMLSALKEAASLYEKSGVDKPSLLPSIVRSIDMYRIFHEVYD